MKFLLHSFFILLSFAFVFLWQQTILSQYTVQIIGALIVIYLLIAFKKKHDGSKILFGGSFDIFVLTTIVLFLVVSNGGVLGTFFFFMYILAFCIAVAFEPATVFVLVAASLAFFGQLALTNDPLTNAIKLGSLVILSPLAFYFGRQYRKDEFKEDQMQIQDEETAAAAQSITKDIKEVLEKEHLKKEDETKLQNALEEAETIQEESSK